MVLAAGLSGRMGRSKAALMIGGKPLLAWAVGGVLGVCGRMIVVGGKYFEDVRRICGSCGNAEAVREILEAPCRETLRGLIERHGFTTLDLRDRGILTDIDTEDDYRNAVEWMERREDGAR